MSTRTFVCAGVGYLRISIQHDVWTAWQSLGTWWIKLFLGTFEQKCRCNRAALAVQYMVSSHKSTFVDLTWISSQIASVYVLYGSVCPVRWRERNFEMNVQEANRWFTRRSFRRNSHDRVSTQARAYAARRETRLALHARFKNLPLCVFFFSIFFRFGLVSFRFGLDESKLFVAGNIAQKPGELAYIITHEHSWSISWTTKEGAAFPSLFKGISFVYTWQYLLVNVGLHGFTWVTLANAQCQSRFFALCWSLLLLMGVFVMLFAMIVIHT